MRRVRNPKLCPILNAKIIAQSIEELPIIVQFKEDIPNINNYLANMSNRIKSKLPLIDGFSGYMPTDLIYKLANSPDIDYISFDSRVYTLLDIATPSIDAYFPHDKGYEGEGITIAVIDTGLSPHYDLMRPSNRIVGFKDFINNKDIPYDDNGHGTQVAGIIAGNGYSSRGKYVGVAPKSNILAIKALDENGGGSSSKIIEAISYIIDTKDKYNTKIINLSIGTPANNTCDKDPLCRAVEKAVEAGLIVVVAAGNSGPERGTILSPGTSRNAITVGAVDDKRTIDPSDDTIAPFSSRGPTLEGLTKPDLLAPGVSINSLSNTKLDGYSALSSTSMATPLVSGAVALLLNKYNDLKPYEVKKRLLKSCIDIKDSKEMQGIGMLNLKLLFEEDTKINNVPSKSTGFDGELFEIIIMILIILFLLDSRI